MDAVRVRIRKLLAIAADAAASEAEKLSALRIAAALASRHGIDLDSCEQVSDRGFVFMDLGSYVWVPYWVPAVAFVLEECFSVRVVNVASYGGGVVVRCFGALSSGQVAVYVYACLRREFLQLWRQWKRGRRVLQSAKAERGFHLSAAVGLVEKLKAADVAECDVVAGGMIVSGSVLDRELSKACKLSDARLPEYRLNLHGYLGGKQIHINKAVRGDSSGSGAGSNRERRLL